VKRGEVADPYRQAPLWGHEFIATQQRQPHAIAAQAALIAEYAPKPLTLLPDLQDVDDWGDA
jgi:hypothetical protein